jgi:chromosome segregation ATPase
MDMQMLQQHILQTQRLYADTAAAIQEKTETLKTLAGRLDALRDLYADSQRQEQLAKKQAEEKGAGASGNGDDDGNTPECTPSTRRTKPSAK